MWVIRDPGGLARHEYLPSWVGLVQPGDMVSCIAWGYAEGPGCHCALHARIVALPRPWSKRVPEGIAVQVTAAVHNYLAVHHPLSRKNAPSSEEQQQQGQEMPQRVARYSTQGEQVLEGREHRYSCSQRQILFPKA